MVPPETIPETGQHEQRYTLLQTGHSIKIHLIKTATTTHTHKKKKINPNKPKKKNSNTKIEIQKMYRRWKRKETPA